MLDTSRPENLRKVLLVDAGTCLISGILMTLGGDALSRLTGIPQPLLVVAGLVLFPVALFITVVAARALSAGAVGLIVAGNAIWVAGSAWLLLGAITPNAIGALYIAGQAVAVAALTGLEARGAIALADARHLSAQPKT